MLLAFRDIDFIEVGCDEAGRGCLAGPVVASAVILPKNFKNELLNDSKKIVEKDRLKLKKIIEEEAIDFAVSFIYEAQIDEINILSKKFNFILVDGNRFKNYKKIKHECVIKGDGKYMSIAAASILAKTYRDEYMMKLHEAHPEYNWNKSKGYPTLAHREAIKKYGPTIYHRKSFNLLGTNQLELF
jgi:ribonuclease HII